MVSVERSRDLGRYEFQQILGHSDPNVTQRYAHLSKRSLQDAADSADDIISKALRRSA